MAKQTVLPVRAYLIHITHYDPRWVAQKEQEKPFDLKVGLEIVDAMAESQMNTLIVACSDGLKYKSHPELKRHYSVPMRVLKELAAAARARNIEVVPKLNFSQSHLHRHNDWFAPHHRLFDNDEYFRLSFEVADEILSVVGGAKFFHVGMDEDHNRSIRQYCQAIITLRKLLKKRGLRTIIWNDSANQWRAADVHKEKSLAAEKAIPKDVVQVVWDYKTVKTPILRRVVDQGFELWGAPGPTEELVTKMRQTLLRLGGKGIVLTRWIPCVQENRQTLVDGIRQFGPLCQ